MFETSGEYCVPEPGVRFYNPRHFCAHKAIVIRLQDESCERLVVGVEDPEGVVERINRAVGASLREPSLVSSTAWMKKGLGLSEEPRSLFTRVRKGGVQVSNLVGDAPFAAAVYYSSRYVTGRGSNTIVSPPD